MSFNLGGGDFSSTEVEAGLAALKRLPNVCQYFNCPAVMVPFLAGAMLSCLGCGVVTCLAVQYCRQFSEPRFKLHRLLVVAVLLLTWAQTAADASRTIKIFAIGFSNLLAFLQVRPEDGVSPFMGVILQGQAQVYFCIKGWRLCRNTTHGKWTRLFQYVFLVFAASTIGLALACGLGMSIEITRVRNFVDTTDRISPSPAARRFRALVPIHFIASAAVGSFITAVIVRQLLVTRYRLNRHARIRSTNDRIRWLVSLTVQSGVIVSALQIATVLLWYLTAIPASTAGAWTYLPMFALSRVCSSAFIIAFGSTRTSPQGRRSPVAPLGLQQSTPSYALGIGSASPWLNGARVNQLVPPPPMLAAVPPEMVRVQSWGLLRRSEDAVDDDDEASPVAEKRRSQPDAPAEAGSGERDLEKDALRATV